MELKELHDLFSISFGTAELPLAGLERGKVRDSYPLPGERRLLVTTDRLSAFDRILSLVPYKGQVLNQLSAWWFEQTAGIIPNHMLGTPDPNAMLVVQAEPFLVEVVVRGYITGVTTTSLWYRYTQGERDIYGYHFPDGMIKNEALPQPIITPTTKGGQTGHDERLTCAEVVERGLLDAHSWDQVQAAALAIFQRGQAEAQASGLVLVDTKYEFGRAPDGTVMLIDEVHTPDSSRYWKLDSYRNCIESGEEPHNYDKEFVRLAFAERGYLGDGVPPDMPVDLWLAASQRYTSIYEMLTGQPFLPGAYPVGPRLEENLRAAGIL